MPRRKPAKRKTTTNRSKTSWRYAPRDDLDRQRYGKQFDDNKFKAKVHRSTGGICVCCMKARSEVIHHLWYIRDDGSKVKDTEQYPGDVVNVCNTCHDFQCHSLENWIRNRQDPMLNRNTEQFRAEMIRNWQILNDRITGRSPSTPQPIPMSRSTTAPSKPQWIPTTKRSPFHKESNRTLLSDIPVSAWLLFGAAIVAIVLLVLF